ncbi:heterogeneous nuclear ribonucleoprotein U-like protein 1 isoform X2 [Xenia sp. Carnegie-2017]|nr:heterogeneous nuclear ribonucleoprotein U-like protein 1 isoform X2 [Xenia sp. Carnegie-2017]
MPESETKPHVLRVGWSVDASSLALGEVPYSYGYGGTGKASCNNKFDNYGEPYTTNDVITSYIDLDSSPKVIFFAKNGKYLDIAFQLDSDVHGKTFYPHISVKNMKFVANFGAFNPYFLPLQSFSFIQHLPREMLDTTSPPPRTAGECEVLMMVGLPSSGKTTWINKYVKDNPEKKYNILGTNDVLLKMKVMGLSRKRNYHGRWDALIKQASEILNEMLKIAKNKYRNYILDQTNVYSGARHRKISSFINYRRVAVVLVNDNSVLMSRNAEVVRKDGKVVPQSAFMEMKKNFTLPVQGDLFHEVWYIEENEERARYLVNEFNKEGRKWNEDENKRLNDVEIKTEDGGALKRCKYDHNDHCIGSTNERRFCDRQSSYSYEKKPRIQESHDEHKNREAQPFFNSAQYKNFDQQSYDNSTTQSVRAFHHSLPFSYPSKLNCNQPQSGIIQRSQRYHEASEMYNVNWGSNERGNNEKINRGEAEMQERRSYLNQCNTSNDCGNQPPYGYFMEKKSLGSVDEHHERWKNMTSHFHKNHPHQHEQKDTQIHKDGYVQENTGTFHVQNEWRHQLPWQRHERYFHQISTNRGNTRPNLNNSHGFPRKFLDAERPSIYSFHSQKNFSGGPFYQ